MERLQYHSPDFRPVNPARTRSKTHTRSLTPIHSIHTNVVCISLQPNWALLNGFWHFEPCRKCFLWPVGKPDQGHRRRRISTRGRGRGQVDGRRARFLLLLWSEYLFYECVRYLEYSTSLSHKADGVVRYCFCFLCCSFYSTSLPHYHVFFLLLSFYLFWQ